MDIQVEQSCPQCGGSIVLSESDHLLACPYCNVKLFLQVPGVYRYVLPAKDNLLEDQTRRIYAPYLRFKGNIFFVSEQGIQHRLVDTTQAGSIVSGLPPSLGVRAQAMKLKRLTPGAGGRFLKLSVKAQAVLEKAVQISQLSNRQGGAMYHRAFIGETVSFIYLPINENESSFTDGITGSHLFDLEDGDTSTLETRPFHPRWNVSFMSTLCPQCGWSLDGESDCLVMTCLNCDTAWQFFEKGLEKVAWKLVQGDNRTRLYVPFWKVTAQIPQLNINSFADFLERTNQPMIPKPSWRSLAMSYWIPAVKLRPKIFLQVARQMTLAQFHLQAVEGKMVRNTHPVTLSASEARQSVKICLAASTASRRKIFPLLPKARLKTSTVTLVYLPFIDKVHDWLQPQSATVIPKNNLRFGRSM